MAKLANLKRNLGEGIWNEEEVSWTVQKTRYEIRILISRMKFILGEENVKPCLKNKKWIGQYQEENMKELIQE